MGALSRLTSNRIYENADLRAFSKLWRMRNSLNLLGATLDVELGIELNTHSELELVCVMLAY